MDSPVPTPAPCSVVSRETNGKVGELGKEKETNQNRKRCCTIIKNWYIVCATKCCLRSYPLAENQQWNGERYREGRQRRPMASIRGERNTLIFFSVEKDLPKGEIATKPNHYKLEIVFTAPHNRTTKGTKLNYNTKGLRQIKILLPVKFSRLHKCTVKLIATECCEIKKYKNKFKEGWTESQEPIGGCWAWWFRCKLSLKLQ